jgi:hypothetical protein
MSTTIVPAASATGRPAPIAPAIGSSIRYACAAPAASGALLHLRHAARHAQHHACRRAAEAAAAQEVAQHLLGDLEVRDHAVAQRPDRANRRRGPADHPLRLGADRVHLAAAVVDCNHRRLERDDALAAPVHDDVRRSEIDGELLPATTPQPREQRGRAAARKLRPHRHVASLAAAQRFSGSERGGATWQSDAVTTMSDLDALALALPETTKEVSDDGRPSYRVGGKLFCCQRNRRKDAVDATSGELLDDVLMFRVPDLDVKELMLADSRGVFFTTPHFDGYAAVLLRIRDLGRLERDELEDLVVEAWLTKAPKRTAKAWLEEHGVAEPADERR